MHSRRSYSAIVILSFIFGVSCEVRWCRLSDISSSPHGDGWIQYEDANYVCVRCSHKSLSLRAVDQLDQFECCNGNIAAVGTCNADGALMEGMCSAGIQCDGTKQCVNGSDEVGCGECSSIGYFSCSEPNEVSETNTNKDACIPIEKNCDSKKDCDGGLDETGCEWHGGWCEGFLCGKPHARCIPMSQVCDGTKQCIDGSDEYNCPYCDRQFRCSVFDKKATADGELNTRTAQCVGSFRVCDGKADCANGLDESNCFRWREWAAWSECNPPTVCTKSRERVCVDDNSDEVNAQNCYDVEDYHEMKGIPPVERQTTICSSCVPELAQSTYVPSTADTTEAITLAITTDNVSSTGTNMTSSLGKTSATRDVTTPVSKGSEQTDILPTKLPLVNAPFTQLHTNSNGTANASVTTPVIDPNTSSFIGFTLILAAAITAAIVLILIIFCLLVCCTEKRRKSGKWAPRKRQYKERPVSVPQMYLDIKVDGTIERAKRLPTAQKTTQVQMLRSFSSATGVSAVDSGIDDANSTTSSFEAAHHARQLSIPVVNMLTPPLSRKAANSSHLIDGEDDFPPPPDNLVV